MGILNRASSAAIFTHILVTLSLSLSIDVTKDSIVITPRELAKLSGLSSQTNDDGSGLDIFQQLARALQACGLKSTATGQPAASAALTKVMLTSVNNITCNDGSPAG